MPEYGDADFRVEVVFAELLERMADIVADAQSVEHRILGKQAAVVGRDTK